MRGTEHCFSLSDQKQVLANWKKSDSVCTEPSKWKKDWAIKAALSSSTLKYYNSTPFFTFFFNWEHVSIYIYISISN